MKLKEEKIYKGVVKRYSPLRAGGNHLSVEFLEDYSDKNKRLSLDFVEKSDALKKRLHEITIETNRLDIGGRYGNIISISDDLEWNVKLLVAAIKKLHPKERATVPGFISKVLKHYIVNEPVSTEEKLNHSTQNEVDDYQYIKSAQIYLSRLLMTDEDQSYEFYIPDQTFHISSFFRNLYLATVCPELMDNFQYLQLAKFLQLDFEDSINVKLNRRSLILMSPNFGKEISEIIAKLNFSYEKLHSVAKNYCDPFDQKISKKFVKELKEKFGKNEKLIKRFALKQVLIECDEEERNMFREYKMFLDLKEEDIKKSIERLEILREITPKLGKLSTVNQ